MTTKSLCIRTKYFARSALSAPTIVAMSDQGECKDMEHPMENTPNCHIRAVHKLLDAIGMDKDQAKIHIGQLEDSYYFIIEELRK